MNEVVLIYEIRLPFDAIITLQLLAKLCRDMVS